MEPGLGLGEPLAIDRFHLPELTVLRARVEQDRSGTERKRGEQNGIKPENQATRVHAKSVTQPGARPPSKGNFKGIARGQNPGLGVRFALCPPTVRPPMYQSFFGFREMPFNITPDPRFLYLSPTHQEALQHLKYGVQQKKGFIVLVGEVGCGKTTLCRRFLNELDPAHYDTALILNPRVTETQILKAILTELGETKLARSQVDLVAQMNRVLLERIEKSRDIVLIVDEAQNLKFEVLEQIRLGLKLICTEAPGSN